jgi:hypothetical protein
MHHNGRLDDDDCEPAVGRRVEPRIASSPTVPPSAASGPPEDDATREKRADVKEQEAGIAESRDNLQRPAGRAHPPPAHHTSPATEDERSLRAPSTEPRSAAERWARHVLKACQSDADLKTLGHWARCIGVSYSSVRESCRLLDIQPRDARDFVRVLQAIIKSHLDHCPPKVFLDVSDTRTLDALLSRSGMTVGLRTGVTIEEFLQAQRLIARENEGLRVLRRLLGLS